MALNIQNIIDSSIASTGQPGNTATSSNSTLNIPAPTAPEPSVIPVAEIAKPSAPQPTLTAPPVRSQVAQNLGAITNSIAGIQAGVDNLRTQEQTPAKPNYGQAIVDLANTDFAGERQNIREEQQVAEKEERARRLGERLIERDNSYRDRIEAAEKNPEGKLRGALNDEINDMERERSRELADLSFSYNIALGDYNAAQSAVDDRIGDMEADIARRTKAFETAFTIAQNDLSESEKLQVQQAFQREQAQVAAKNQKEIAKFKYELEAPQRAFENQIANAKLAAEKATASALQTGISPVTGKAFTDGQGNAGTFALRMEQAEEELSGGRGFFVPFLPNFAKSQDRRQFEQAEKNFITAVLRRESGAAISAEEFADARAIYIPQPSDNDDTLAQKAQARATVLQGLKNASAGSYDQLKTSVGSVDVTNSYLDQLDVSLKSGDSIYSKYLNP